MKSLKELYKVGPGPSSSHTIWPQRAANIFKNKNPEATRFEVTLYWSLSLTGKGHLTDFIILKTLHPTETKIIRIDNELEFHPNWMKFEAYDKENNLLDTWTTYSVWGWALSSPEEKKTDSQNIYDLTTMNDIMDRCVNNNKEIWQYVEDREWVEIWDYLAWIWNTMKDSIDRWIKNKWKIPWPLNLQRKAWEYLDKWIFHDLHRYWFLFWYTLAVAEENWSGWEIVTAPTCWAAGVVPGLMKYIQSNYSLPDEKIIKWLAVGWIVGNLAKFNASISGAEVGCQWEVWVACSMAAAAAAYLLNWTVKQIEYAAEIWLEHHLWMTCDPVLGLVQIPCIERNAMAALRAMDAAKFALMWDGNHLISYDEVVKVMYETGKDLQSHYRETAQWWLAKMFQKKYNYSL